MEQKAVVTNPGKVYTTYREFANQYGYPDAAVTFDSGDHRPKLAEGTTVNLLTYGLHPASDQRYLHIVETPLGYRYIIAEEGLRFLPPDLLTIEEKRALIAKLTAEIGEEVALKVGDYARIVKDHGVLDIGYLVRIADINENSAFSCCIIPALQGSVGDGFSVWYEASSLVKVAVEDAHAELMVTVDLRFRDYRL